MKQQTPAKTPVKSGAVARQRYLPKRLLFLLPVLVPVAWMFRTIGHYGVNFPYSDAWIIVPTFQHIDQGLSMLAFHELWQAESHHRLFFTKSLISALAYLTDWNSRAEMYASLVCCLVTAAFVYMLVVRTIRNTALAFTAMLITAFWLFSPVQSENWLWGWDVAWFMCTSAAIAAIYFISRASGKRLYIWLGQPLSQP